MSSLKRALSIGKEKKQPQQERDPEALKRTISRPHSLAPKPVIDEWAKSMKLTRIEAEVRVREAMASQLTTQPRAAYPKAATKLPEGRVKQHLKVFFVDNTKTLPPTPIPSPIDEQSNAVPDFGKNLINVSVARKSAASSWFCAGPDAEDPSDQAIFKGKNEDNKLITEAMPGGPVFVFRNEEERRQAIRVLATLRESMYGDSGDSGMPKCGRECPQCLQKIAERRTASSANGGSADSCSPQLTVVVTEVSGEEVEDQRMPRLSLAGLDSCLADEVNAQLKEYMSSQ